jgi:glucose-1-phosphate thymidylyltransferase
MIKKGIILAGGIGSRLNPLTKSVNKQLLPIYNKPLIFYPLSILMENNIKDILIIVNKGQLKEFRKILPEKNNLGIKITYKEQRKPNGLPDAFLIGKNFIKNHKVALILGDNFFYSNNFKDLFFNNSSFVNGSKIFISRVKKPSLFGVATLKRNKIIKLEEKPKLSKSNFAVTGLYLFDKKVSKLSKSLKPSSRGELEIIDLLNIYLSKNELSANVLGGNCKWFDAGSADNLLLASNFVKKMEIQKKTRVACLEKISLEKNWTKISNIKKLIKFYGNSNYSKFLISLIKKKKK